MQHGPLGQPPAQKQTHTFRMLLCQDLPSNLPYPTVKQNLLLRGKLTRNHRSRRVHRFSNLLNKFPLPYSPYSSRASKSLYKTARDNSLSTGSWARSLGHFVSYVKRGGNPSHASQGRSLFFSLSPSFSSQSDRAAAASVGLHNRRKQHPSIE